MFHIKLKTMLSIKFPGAIFISSLLLLITVPAISFNSIKNDGPSHFLIDSSSAPKTPLNKQATQFISKYIRQNSEGLELVKQKRSASFELIEEIFAKYELPVELKYLAVVESELNLKAVSRVGAAGPWQLMPGTAKVLVLKISRKYYERTNLKKSTKAAALYLRDLYTQYGDWLLVLAAYNCGPGPVNKAIRKTGSRNFWKLQYHLPAESRDHVKKYIATHYYFEGDGGITTLTKAENIKYAQALSLWASAQLKALAESLVIAQTSALTDSLSNKTVVLK